MRRFRIRKYDSRNWVIEEFLPGNLNPFTGLMAEDFWQIVGYWGKLKELIPYLINNSIILESATEGVEILQAIKQAEANILRQLETMYND